MSKWQLLQYRAGERGSVFLLSMVALMVLLILGASLIERAQTAVYRTSVENRSAKSFHLAEAGVSKALWALNQPNGWLTYSGETQAALPGGFADVTVTPSTTARGVFTDRLTLVATGYLPGPSGAQRHPCRIRVVAHKDPRYFAYAVFGDEKVTVGNGTVTIKADSYTSDDGPYGGSNVAAQADIGTNSTASAAVEILPQGEVRGNISVGVGAAPPSLCVDNRGTVTGTISALPTANILPSITSAPPGAVFLGDVWLELDQQLVLNEGIYHMTDLDIFGNAKVVCNGKVVIYLDQAADQWTPDVRIGGNGIVNTSGIPSNLVLYCADEVVNVTINGNGAFYGGIYAPKASVVLNKGAVHGALVGRTVTLNGANAHVHYDEALRDNVNPHAVVRSWQQL